MQWFRLHGAPAVSIVGLLLIYGSVASARTPYRSNPPAQAPAISQAASTALPALPEAGTAATCADGQCQKTASGAADLPSIDGVADHHYGTALTWVDTPDAAAKEAVRDQKLVFLIQISGNFTRQEFT